MRWSKRISLWVLAGLWWAAEVTPVPAAGATRPPGFLEWKAEANQVSAHLDDWSLDRLLEAIAAATHWQVYVDPEARHRVRAKFSQLPPGAALRRLLGPLNYALLPGDRGRARLYVFQDARASATRRIEAPAGSAGKGRRLDDELIVRLSGERDETIEDLAKRLGASIIGRADALGAYRLRFASAEAAEEARRRLAGETGLSAWEANYLYDRPDTTGAPLPPGGLGLTLKPKPLAPGEGVVVAVVDTAVQGDAAGIQDFLLPGISVAGSAAVPGDQLSHGTSMAATLLHGLAALSADAEATPVRILPVDVYGSQASANSFDIALGIHAAVRQGATIVNLSLGGAEESPFLRDLIRAGREQGVVFLAAAGNEPVPTPTFPAAYPEVIAVTALNRQGEVAPYANYGQFVDVGAPGVSYVSFWGQPYVVVGTSPATAHASAMAASLAAASPQRGPQLEAEIRQRLAVSRADLSP